MCQLNEFLATLSWLLLRPSYRNDRIRCDIVLVTVPTFLPCHLSQTLDLYKWTLESVASIMWSNRSVLTIIFQISKDCPSLARAHFCSDLMMARSWPHTSWWLSPILFIWTSIQSLSLLSLQDVLTLFLYFFQVVHMDTSSVSQQERQSPEAVSRLESAMFPLDKPESENVWSQVIFELPVTTSSSGWLELYWD